jgi:hypothetical protein
MFADPKKSAARRIKRRLKAGASILVAIAAGAFLACQRGGQEAAGENPGGPDARTGPHERESQGAAAEDGGAADAADAAGGAETALVARDAGPEDGGDGGGAGLVVRDAGADAGDAGKRKVDRVEHRKGMPVRDNLLE